MLSRLKFTTLYVPSNSNFINFSKNEEGKMNKNTKEEEEGKSNNDAVDDEGIK